MPYRKGHTNNPNGRPKGARNKRTEDWERLGEVITTSGAKRFMEIIQRLPEDEFIKNYLLILEYFKPKIQRQEINLDGELNTKVNIKPKQWVNNDNEDS